VRILFDQGTPAPLREHLPGHSVETAYEKGWSALRNGELLAKAEAEFDVQVTTDRNLRHQLNLAGRRIAILVLPTTSWPRLQSITREIAAAADSLKPGQYLEVPL
jgi:predicted nuclease of predicted toxin-antitoxin system